MTKHLTGTRKEWLGARLELLEAEKAHTRNSDLLARRRQDLPWVRIDKEYRFDTEEGSAASVRQLSWVEPIGTRPRRRKDIKR